MTDKAKYRWFFVVIIIFNIISYSVSANNRCNCEIIKSRCVAEINTEGNWIIVKSSTPVCSAVIYSLNNEGSHYTVVTDGIEKEEWLGQSKIKSQQVLSCHVCSDNHYDNQKSAEDDAQSNSSTVNTCENLTLGLSNYTGDCIDNLPHGYGEHVLENGTKYKGNFVNGRMADGEIIYSNGVSYRGEIKKFSPEGQGEIAWENGDKIIGQFKNGTPISGKKIYSNGNIYEGEFKDWKPHGYGKNTSPVHVLRDTQYVTILEGQFINGAFQSGFMSDQNGRTCKIIPVFKTQDPNCLIGLGYDIELDSQRMKQEKITKDESLRQYKKQLDSEYEEFLSEEERSLRGNNSVNPLGVLGEINNSIIDMGKDLENRKRAETINRQPTNTPTYSNPSSSLPKPPNDRSYGPCKRRCECPQPGDTTVC